MPRKVVLDCDPGHDDAVALLLAHGSPDIELLAVTTVAGNQTLEKVTRNALAVARVGGITGVPFAAGCARPLLRDARVAGDIHGESGLDGPVLPEPELALDPRHAVDLIIDTVLAHPPGTVTLVPTGPLTNVALAVRKEPRIVGRVAEVVLMGGAYGRGNRTPVSEFNIGCDPEAAQIVVREPWPLTMVGLDLTHQALATPEVVARIAALNTAPARFVADLLEFFGGTYRDAAGLPGAAGARPVRGRVRDRPGRAHHPPRAAGRRTARSADHRHDGRRPARHGARGVPYAGRSDAGPRPVLGPGRRRADPARRPLRS